VSSDDPVTERTGVPSDAVSSDDPAPARSGVPSGAASSDVPPSDEPTPEERRAAFRVVRGEPTDEELAALTVVLAAAVAAPPADPPPRPRSAWNDPVARLRRPLAVGPGAWRTSTWPR
jgi:Acyl-CoA carboxylase epsilon subunit